MIRDFGNPLDIMQINMHLKVSYPKEKLPRDQTQMMDPGGKSSVIRILINSGNKWIYEQKFQATAKEKVYCVSDLTNIYRVRDRIDVL